MHVISRRCCNSVKVVTANQAKCERVPFLAIPPFPRSRLQQFTRASESASILGDDEIDALIGQVTAALVGGTYWGAQPELGDAPYALQSGMFLNSETSLRRVRWSQACDPWHLLAGASELHCERDEQSHLLAGLAGVPVRLAGEDGPAKPVAKAELRCLLRSALIDRQMLDPFTGTPLSWAGVIMLCSEWRQLVDSNRGLAAVYGFAGWKRATTEPLLWDGSNEHRFNRRPETLCPADKAAVWRSRTSNAQLAALEKAGVTIIEVEDGFIRSAGLGANCVPPQSIVVDGLGIHFDARSPSGLENILQEDRFAPELLARAEALCSKIVSLGLSKYDAGQDLLDRRSERLQVLVPGQVEDDRAVLSSVGPPLTNLELLRRVRAARQNAYIIYKPHPDVEAGHRKGGIEEATALELADEVVRKPSISSWIDVVDEVHVNSSLAGFEALMRSRNVTTYGVPFYAGWGLTEDLGPVPERRTARRSLTELVAATLIVYPRYVDPVTNLPCSPEVLIARLSDPEERTVPGSALMVRARQLQGRLRQRLNLLGTMR